MFRQQIEQFYDVSGLVPDDMTGKRFPLVLCSIIKTASLEVIQHRRLEVVPLAIFLYQDGNHQMLTLTVTLRARVNVNEVRTALQAQEWEYFPLNWEDITKINVPNLTPKERLYIEEFLFSADDDAVHGKLPFRFSQDEQESLRIFKEYARHYRRYPSYFQVIL